LSWLRPSHCRLALFYIRIYLKAKRRVTKNSNISPCKKYDLQKNPRKETKILRDNYNSLNSSQASTQAKISSFKNPHIKIELVVPRDQNTLSYYASIMSLKHIILALVCKTNNKQTNKHAYSRLL
jgi:hypothetical protein